MPMRAYNLVLGLPWLQSRNPDVDCQCSGPFVRKTPGQADVVAVDRVEQQECHTNEPAYMGRVDGCSEGGSSLPDIQILGETAFHDVLASEQVVGTFFLYVRH